MTSTDTINWQFRNFAELSAQELYALLKLRVDVFVVEQACAYPELDDLDTLPDTRHLCGYIESELACYSRTLAPTDVNAPARIGRVVVSPAYRRKGLANAMLRLLIDDIDGIWPGQEIQLSAQLDAMHLYENLGFSVVSDTYVEDGIPHRDMLRKPERQAS